jgi:hypothetical protein
MHKEQCSAPNEGKKIFTHTTTSENSLNKTTRRYPKAEAFKADILTESQGEFMFNARI